MSDNSCEVAIVGLGAMGAALAWRLAARGVRVIGFDRGRPPHTLGSSSGRSRIIREAYFEHPQYVPIVQRAYGLWAELESAARTRLFRASGGLMIGAGDSVLLHGARESARRHQLLVQEWSTDEIRQRVPALLPAPGMRGLFEPRAGVLDPEGCVRAMLAEAARLGAHLRVDTPVEGWEEISNGIAVTTGPGAAVICQHLVLAAGGWLASLVPDLALPLTIERAVQYWFPTEGDARYSVPQLPIFLLETADGRMLYGLPDQGHGLKLAEHHAGELTSLDAIVRQVGAEESSHFHAFVVQYVPDLPHASDAAICFYTNTPDNHFLLDRHPRHPKVYLLSACSGHGFKFSPALGELVADDLMGRPPDLDLAPFRLARLTA